MRHLILGGGGFIGGHVARQLTQAGEDVTIAGRRLPERQALSAKPIAFTPFQLSDVDWDALISGFDVIHHYAWASIPQTATDDPVSDLDVHVRSTLALLEAARRVGGKRLIFTSSGGTVYGPLASGVAREDDPLRPIGAYGAGKLAAENYIGVYHRSNWVDARIARLSNPYGPGQDGGRGQGLVSIFARKALAGETLTIFGDGEIVRDYVHVKDVSSALCKLAMTPAELGPAPVLNIGSGRGSSINDVVAMLSNQLRRTIDTRYVPGREFDVRTSVLNVDRARHLLGWTAHTSLEAGIAELLAQFGAEAEMAPALEEPLAGRL